MTHCIALSHGMKQYIFAHILIQLGLSNMFSYNPVMKYILEWEFSAISFRSFHVLLGLVAFVKQTIKLTRKSGASGT